MKIKHPAPFIIAFAFFAVVACGAVDDLASDSGSVINWQPKSNEITGLTLKTVTNRLGSNTQAHLITDGMIETGDDLKALLNNLRGENDYPSVTGTYILHVVKWTSPDRRTTKFNKWYLYDPTQPKPHKYQSFSEAEWIARSVIPGQQNLFLAYLQIPSEDDTSEQTKTDPISYSIKISKQALQFDKDLGLFLSILNPAETVKSQIEGVSLKRDESIVAYTASLAFTTGFQACGITITPSSTPGKAAAVASAAVKPEVAEKTVSPSISYVDEPRSWRGLSVAVPLASYKDVTFDQTNNTLTPKTVTRQNTYICFDLYCPKIEPLLMKKSYLPHPFVGVPFTGKVLQHPMAGVACGFYGVEVFYSGVCDMENRDSSGARKTTWKGTYGVKISLEAAKTLFAKASGK